MDLDLMAGDWRSKGESRLTVPFISTGAVLALTNGC